MKPQLPRRELLKQLAAGALGASVLGSGVLMSCLLYTSDAADE